MPLNEWFLALAVVAAAIALWWKESAIREVALGWARQVCDSASVQLLDQTVRIQSFRIRSLQPWSVERSYRFSFSESGTDRGWGVLRLCDRRFVHASYESEKHGRIVVSKPPT